MQRSNKHRRAISSTALTQTGVMQVPVSLPSNALRIIIHRLHKVLPGPVGCVLADHGIEGVLSGRHACQQRSVQVSQLPQPQLFVNALEKGQQFTAGSSTRAVHGY